MQPELAAFNRGSAPQNSFEPAVELIDLARRFGEVAAVANVSLQISRGEFFSLLGPSGCGKTTLLRLIAGLDRPDSGSLRIGGKDSAGVPAHKRPVNTVFQSYALFPHMSVDENIRFGLRMKKVARQEAARRVGEVMELLEIGNLAGRMPGFLSGGQKQRVALARAIVNEPEVLLLDEPLGALDLKLRKQLQMELRRLQRRLGMTFVYVTHDQDEALTMSDRVAVMNAGRIEQLGTSLEVYGRPRTRFVAQFLGSCNVIEGTVAATRDGSMAIETAAGRITVNVSSSEARPQSTARVSFAIRPEKIRIVNTSGAELPNQIKARAVAVTYTGAATHYDFQTAAGLLKVTVLNSGDRTADITANDTATLQLPADAFVVLEGPGS